MVQSIASRNCQLMSHSYWHMTCFLLITYLQFYVMFLKYFTEEVNVYCAFTKETVVVFQRNDLIRGAMKHGVPLSGGTLNDGQAAS